VSENLKLAELKGYIMAKVDEYDAINPDCKISAKRVADDFYRVLEIVIDMLGTKEKETITVTLDSKHKETLKSLEEFE